MKNLEIMQVKINEILNKAKQEAENLQSQIDTANKAKEDAAAAFIVAQKAADPKAYADAAAKRREYKDIIQLYTNKLNALSNKAKISPEQYIEMKAQTIAALEELNDAAKEKIITVMGELEALMGELGTELDHGTALLRQLDLLNSPMAAPTSEYKYRSKDGGVIDIVRLISAIIGNSSTKYLKEDK